MLSTLVATKLHRPRPTSHLVARPRLTQRLEQGLREGRRLILVVAPAGYGKTTLVAEWLSKSAVPSAWLSLDEGDNDPNRFFANFVSALQGLDLEVGSSFLETFRTTPPTCEEFVYPLIGAVAKVDRPILLALDDYHLISSASVQEAMVLLLRRTPPNLHLVVLTRADPPFPLSRLRVREWMTEIRVHDLRFTPEEIGAFLNALHHLDLSAEQIEVLESRTEGWAAGVQLAALSLRGFSDERATQFITAFSGSHHYVVDYLFEEVLGRQPEHVREFLLQTSILERMCAPLCDAVLSDGAVRQWGSRLATSDAPPAQEVLENLERSNLFLVPLDDERHWYRYHHLFVDALKGMLHTGSPADQIAGLHDRASVWYGQNGFMADAYRHALSAGNHARAVGILEENAWPMVLRAEFGMLRRWMQALPSELLSHNPWLCVNYAWALVFGEAAAAESHLKAAEQQLQSFGSSPWSEQIQCHIIAVRAWIAYENDEPEQAVVLSRQALELSPQIDATVSSGLKAMLGVGYRTQSDMAGAACAFAEAVELAQSSGNVMIEVVARASLGTVSEMMGRLHEAEALYQEALQRAILHDSPVAAQAYLCLARLHREWNNLSEARLFAEKAVESWRMWGFMDALALANLHLARIEQARNNLPGVVHALEEAARVIDQHVLEPRLQPEIGAVRARLWLAQGRVEDARSWAATRELHQEGSFDLRNEIEYLTLGRIFVADGRLNEAERLLSRLEDAMEATGRRGHLIELLVLRATLLHMRADANSALAVLEQAVRLARPEGYTRVFLDEGKPIETLLELALVRWQDRDLLAYARRLVTASAEESGRTAIGQAPEAAILSERELEVLQLIASGCSNQEIARKLVVAIGTAKRHTANIFDKLDVHNRTEAVARARQLDLL